MRLFSKLVTPTRAKAIVVDPYNSPATFDALVKSDHPANVAASAAKRSKTFRLLELE